MKRQGGWGRPNRSFLKDMRQYLESAGSLVQAVPLHRVLAGQPFVLIHPIWLVAANTERKLGNWLGNRPT
jgi:hypothetical protein